MTYDRKFSNKAAIAAVQYGREGDYWLNKFSGELQKSLFPRDRKKSHPGSPVMDSLTFELNTKCVSKLMELSKGLNHRLYIILTAVLTVLLHRYTGNKDIIVGSPIFRQEKEEHFVNTVLALRNQVSDHITFKELLLDRVRQTIVEASEHQNYPIETLLFHLNMSVSNNEFPLFDVVILLENIHEKKYIRHIRPNIIFSFLRTHTSVKGVLEYNSALYEKSTAARIVNHFTRLIEAVVFSIDIPVSHIDILSEEEKNQLLVDFNNTGAAYPAEKTIHEVFAEQCRREPDAVAVTYEGELFTYKEVNEKAGRLASFLRSSGVKPTEPVAIGLEDSHLVVVGILGILKAGGVYLPIALDSPEERKKYILADCNVRLLLTDGGKSFNHVSRVIHLDDGEVYRNQRTFSRQGTGSDPAYIIYTSGSTGAPKGVLVNHRSVLRLVKSTNYVEFNKGDSILLTGALDFDASTFELWGALLNGLTLHLVSKDTILNCEKLKQAIKKKGVSTMWMTSPLFNQVADLDIDVFAGLSNLLVGGDVVSPPHIRRLRHCFQDIKVINGYGPTENTTFSLTFPIDKDYEENIPIGKPINNSTAYIFDHWSYLVPIGIPGELYVGGDGLSLGYLNNPELTVEKFIDFSLNTRHSTPAIRLYRTGDRVRWLPDGNIEFLGRIDNQVKIRGYRIEPGEIENHLLRFDGIGRVVVIDRENKDGEKFLCAYITTGDSPNRKQETIDVGEVKRHLLEQLPDYMVPAHFMQLDELPLKAMGKVDRDALPVPEVIDSRAAYASPRNPLEEKLVEIWSGILRVEKDSLGIDSDFFELGGHSLKATVLISKIHKALHVKVPLAELFRTPTIRELAGFIMNVSMKDKHISIEPAEKRDYYPLSSAQKRLYVLQQIEPDSTAYNMPQIISISLHAAIDVENLENVIKQLIERHESFRTSFCMIEEEPVQKIHDEVKFKIELSDLNKIVQDQELPIPNSNLPTDFIRPFDLTQSPLLRVGVWKTGQENYHLIVDIHHIISDGVSQEILRNDFVSLSSNEELPPLRLQYKDYAHWQIRQLYSAGIKKQEEYWLGRFKGPIPILNLPTDYSRTTDTLSLSGEIQFKAPKELSEKIKRLIVETGSTLFIFLLSVYTIMLSKYANQEDIVVGCTIANRTHDDLNHIIGMFVNLLAMRNFPVSTKTFRQFLEEVKADSIEAFENQDYQFEELVGKLGIPRTPYRNPLTDVVFAMQNFNPGGDQGDRDKKDLLPTDEIWEDKGEQSPGVAKFDITLGAVEAGGLIWLHFDYRKNLFKLETIKQKCRHLLNIIDEVTTNPDIKISGIKMMDQAEMEKLKRVIVNEPGQSNAAASIPATPLKRKLEAEFGF